MKSMLELLQQFEEEGYVTHDCPNCEEETNPVEPDANRAYCENCQSYVSVPYVI